MFLLPSFSSCGLSILINGLTFKNCNKMYTTNVEIVAFSVIKLGYKLA